MSAGRALQMLVLGVGLWAGRTTTAAGQALPEAATPARAAARPRSLLKVGLRLTHLLYQPDARGWQLVLPSSVGFEYRLTPRFSLYTQAEADISAGRAARGRRRATAQLAPSTSLSLGTRYYFNQPAATGSAVHPNFWGNYLALESSAQLTQSSGRNRRNRGLGAGGVVPAVLVLCGMQHAGPGHHLLYDLNAGLGIEGPPSYATDSKVLRSWDVAAQVNLRVYFINQQRRPIKPLLLP